MCAHGKTGLLCGMPQGVQLKAGVRSIVAKGVCRAAVVGCSALFGDGRFDTSVHQVNDFALGFRWVFPCLSPEFVKVSLPLRSYVDGVQQLQV